jgi:hypothetical protein
MRSFSALQTATGYPGAGVALRTVAGTGVGTSVRMSDFNATSISLQYAGTGAISIMLGDNYDDFILVTGNSKFGRIVNEASYSIYSDTPEIADIYYTSANYFTVITSNEGTTYFHITYSDPFNTYSSTVRCDVSTY